MGKRNETPKMQFNREEQKRLITEIMEEDAKDGLYQEYPELDGTNALCNEMIWNEIYEEYSNEQYPPFGGPFTNALEFIDWLRLNYEAPKRIK